jgi:hypothetical protein
MWKGYAFGFFSAALAVLLVAGIWVGTQPKQESGLLWGDTVYTSKQQFDGYLKSKGLSYKTWVARNPGAAPWEPESVTVGAITVRASTRTIQLLLAAVGWLLATVGAMLLLRRGSSGGPGVEKGSVALFSAVLASVLFAGIWYTTQARQPAGLVWGGTTYTSKQEFKTYLKAKGLSYKVWLARNPGAAPWEPKPVAAPTPAKKPEVTRAASSTKTPEASGDSLGRPLAAGIGLMAAAAGALLLWRRRRPVTARYTTPSVAFSGAGALRGGKAVGSAASASMQRVGVVASGATDSVKAAVPRYGARAGVVASGVTERLKADVPRYSARVLGAGRRIVRLEVAGARHCVGLVAERMREREVSLGKVAAGLLTATAAVAFGMMVVVLLPSL